MKQTQPLQLAPENAIGMKISNIDATKSIAANKLAAQKATSGVQAEAVPVATAVDNVQTTLTPSAANLVAETPSAPSMPAPEVIAEPVVPAAPVAPTNEMVQAAPAVTQVNSDIVQTSQVAQTADVNQQTNGQMLAKEFSPAEELIAPFTATAQTETLVATPEVIAEPVVPTAPVAPIVPETITPTTNLQSMTMSPVDMTAVSEAYQKALTTINKISSEIEELKATINDGIALVNKMGSAPEVMSSLQPEVLPEASVQPTLVETITTPAAPVAPVPTVPAEGELISFAPPGAGTNIFDEPAPEQPMGLTA